MKSENTFIAPSVISLRDGIRKLNTCLEARPKVPANITGDATLLLNRFCELQVRLGGVLDAYTMEIDRMLSEL